jgi:ferritin-like metal-binding protein YciE
MIGNKTCPVCKGTMTVWWDSESTYIYKGRTYCNTHRCNTILEPTLEEIQEKLPGLEELYEKLEWKAQETKKQINRLKQLIVDGKTNAQVDRKKRVNNATITSRTSRIRKMDRYYCRKSS